MDSWIVSHRLDGSTTTSYTPGSTDGAASFSASSSGMRASSPSQSQWSPDSHSHPYPAGGASVRIVSNSPPEIPTASTTGYSRTRCWVVTVPARSAKNLFSLTCMIVASTWSTRSSASSRRLHPASSAILSPVGTSNGSISYAEIQVRSAWTGSGASSMGSRFTALATAATSTACAATRAAPPVVRSMPAAKPQVPSLTTRTDSPTSSASSAVSSAASWRLRVWLRMRSRRKSACSAPSSRARVRAASASARSGSAVKAGSMSCTLRNLPRRPTRTAPASDRFPPLSEQAPQRPPRGGRNGGRSGAPRGEQSGVGGTCRFGTSARRRPAANVVAQ